MRIKYPWSLNLAAVGGIAFLCFLWAINSVSAPAPHFIPVTAQGWQFPLVVSPNGRYLAATSTRVDAINLYDMQTGYIRLLTTTGITQFYQYGMSCYALAFSPDSKTLADGGAEYGSASNINTWDTTTGVHKTTLFTVASVGTSFCYTPDGRYLVVPCRDHHVHVLDAQTGKTLRIFPSFSGDIASLALSPDGRQVAIGGITPACVVQIRDFRTGRLVWTQPVAMPDGVVSSLAFSPDGQILARGGQSNVITLYDSQTGRVRARLSDPPPEALTNWAGNDASREVAFSPDGRFLVGAGIFRMVVWSARTYRIVMRPAPACKPFSFLPSGHTLAATIPLMPQSYIQRTFLRYLHHHNGNIVIWPL